MPVPWAHQYIRQSYARKMLSAGKGKALICNVTIPPMASSGIQCPKWACSGGCVSSLCAEPWPHENQGFHCHIEGHICPFMTPKAQASVWGPLIGRLAISLCCGHSRHRVHWCEGSNCPNHSPVTDSSWGSSGRPEAMVILAVSKAGFPRGRILFVSVPSESSSMVSLLVYELVSLPTLISFLKMN